MPTVAAMATPAARITDPHACPVHGGGPILPAGCPTVLIGGLPSARVTDLATCVGPPDVIAMGSSSVLIGGLPAARLGDQCAHGGAIVAGCPTVLIGGPTPSAASFGSASQSGAPLVKRAPCPYCAQL
jgi:uncharacterized Zn-binding protein involved in type VI secretion